MKLEPALPEQLDQTFQEKAAKTGAEDRDRQEEARALAKAAGRDPALSVRGETAAGNHAVQVGMVDQGLAPGVKDGEEADPGAQVFGVIGHGAKRARGGAKEQAVEQALVLKSQVGQGLGQGKDHVEVRDGEQAVEAGLDPAGLGLAAALGTVAVAAGVVGGTLVAAGRIVAALQMPAQSGGAAADQGGEHALLGGRELGSPEAEKLLAIEPDHVGDFVRGRVMALRGEGPGG